MKKKIRTIYISDEVWEIIKKLATKQNRTISNFLEEYFRKGSK